ncbi:unnamed protein product, partial [Closterium sp. NIES-53]
TGTGAEAEVETGMGMGTWVGGGGNAGEEEGLEGELSIDIIPREAQSIPFPAHGHLPWFFSLCWHLLLRDLRRSIVSLADGQGLRSATFATPLGFMDFEGEPACGARTAQVSAGESRRSAVRRRAEPACAALLRGSAREAKQPRLARQRAGNYGSTSPASAAAAATAAANAVVAAGDAGDDGGAGGAARGCASALE